MGVYDDILKTITTIKPTQPKAPALSIVNTLNPESTQQLYSSPNPYQGTGERTDIRLPYSKDKTIAVPSGLTSFLVSSAFRFSELPVTIPIATLQQVESIRAGVTSATKGPNAPGAVEKPIGPINIRSRVGLGPNDLSIAQNTISGFEENIKIRPPKTNGDLFQSAMTAYLVHGLPQTLDIFGGLQIGEGFAKDFLKVSAYDKLFTQALDRQGLRVSYDNPRQFLSEWVKRTQETANNLMATGDKKGLAQLAQDTGIIVDRLAKVAGGEDVKVQARGLMDYLQKGADALVSPLGKKPIEFPVSGTKNALPGYAPAEEFRYAPQRGGVGIPDEPVGFGTPEKADINQMARLLGVDDAQIKWTQQPTLSSGRAAFDIIGVKDIGTAVSKIKEIGFTNITTIPKSTGNSGVGDSWTVVADASPEFYKKFGIQKLEQNVRKQIPSASSASSPAVQGVASTENILQSLRIEQQSRGQLPQGGNVSLPSSIEQQVASVNRVIETLKAAEPLRGKQETLYSQERAARLAKSQKVAKETSGEKGFYSELGQLKGELPKVQFEAIRSKLTQEDIDNLFNMIKDSRKLNEWDKIAARKGLAKLFGEYGGTVPTEGEIALLNKALGPEFTNAILDKRTLFTKFKELGLQLANLPRSLMASFDMSAPFRQGLFFVGRPKQFFSAFADMVKAFGSEKTFQAIQESIIRRPTYELMRDSKLAIMEMDRILSTREEAFMSNIAEKIPGVGIGVRASGRAYSAFLNKLRADVFDDLIERADSLGLKPKSNIDLAHSIANYINTATGRGSIGSLERAAPILMNIFFSPRLLASRLNLLNPIYYAKQDPFVRKEALKDLFKLTGVLLSVLGLAKLAGAEVSDDPTNSDFGKIKIGDTRVDIAGGFQQYLVLASRLVTGKMTSSTTGKPYTLGEGYKPTTRFDILMNFIQNKEAPIPALFTRILKGQDAVGKPIDLPKEVGKLFIPILMQDLYELSQSDPKLLPLVIPAFFGSGVQTYEKTKPKASRYSL